MGVKGLYHRVLVPTATGAYSITLWSAMPCQVYTQKDLQILYDPDWLSTPLEPLFERDAQQQDVSDNRQGRGSVLMFDYQGQSLVLKHYSRGGLFSRWVKDSYLFMGLGQTRMWREFKLLQLMQQLDLPVPRPVAARCRRTSQMSYQGDLVTQKIPAAQTLAQALGQGPLAAERWRAIGAVLAQFHRHQIYHADLNANNIMVTEEQQIFLLDFDKGAVRPRNSQRWTQNNLARLRRSLDKCQRLNKHFYFAPGDWQQLLQGYRAAVV